MNYSTGATFIPGGEDSYYMPEVVSPAPQRVLSEVPTNMQGSLAELERQVYSPNQPHLYQPTYTPQPSSAALFPNQPQNVPYLNQNIQAPYKTSNLPAQLNGRYGTNHIVPFVEQPNFSPFPVLRDPPPNVPPTDEQKEATLEAARVAVLASNDPEVQLMWAQDALVYVETAIQDEQRISATQTARARTPRIEHMLREDAMKVVDFLADQHHPKAEFLRGTWLEFGKFGHRIDKKEAFLCFTRASEKGYSRADYRIGMQFESSNDALKAIKYYQRGVDAGDSASCYRLGMMTLLGQHGQVQDFERGLNLVYSAAETADENAPQGAYVFGMLQARQLAQISIPERFLPLDTASAKINIEKAAYLGFAKAQVKMGSAYELCELGCEFSPALSLHYNALAARQGEAEAEMAISKWFLCGHEGLFDKNEEMAFTYAQRAAVGGMATAQFAMGYFYEVGIYVPINYREAKEWYSRAATSGNKDAGNRVDSISRSNTLSRKDHERVAIPKMRQQYGSLGHSALPSLPETESSAIDMPDPSRLSMNTTPAQTRPPSVAPYPIDGVMPRPGIFNQGSSFSNPERPTSAFGINPNLRPGSVASVAGPRPDVYGKPSYPPQNRPPSNMSAGGLGYGRANRLPPGSSPGLGPMPQGRVQSRPGSASPYLSLPNAQSTPPPQKPVKVDIGFSAPLDAAGADRKRRPGADETRAGKPQPPLPSVPAAQQASAAGNDRYYGRFGNQKHSNSDIKPAKITPSKLPSTPNPNLEPTKPTQVSASTKPSGKEGQGPQTFEQMALPPEKNKQDCIVM